ncbi:hypothetical protein Bbelb_204590 [Branchiostoma belcheri]|nr:hypothetical protein Bbelb_204590 [Branchiostoma belcheri]
MKPKPLIASRFAKPLTERTSFIVSFRSGRYWKTRHLVAVPLITHFCSPPVNPRYAHAASAGLQHPLALAAQFGGTETTFRGQTPMANFTLLFAKFYDPYSRVFPLTLPTHLVFRSHSVQVDSPHVAFACAMPIYHRQHGRLASPTCRAPLPSYAGFSEQDEVQRRVHVFKHTLEVPRSPPGSS